MKLTLVLTFITLISTSAVAEKLDIKTHEALIQKLESVLSGGMSDSMIKQSQLSLRLADLYSEHSRLLSMENEGQGEQLNKKQINEDRKKAVGIYRKILPALKGTQKSHSLMQMAHLHSLMMENDEAVKIYKAIVKYPKSVDRSTLAQAMVQLADIYFYRGQFKDSEKLLQQSLDIKENPRKSYAHYRLSWCAYNSGQTVLAKEQLVLLLKNQSLFTQKTGTVDVAFQEEISHDLATFMAANEVSEADVKTLAQLSPESVRQKNLIFLATELDRTAKKRSALNVWKIVGQQKISFEDELEGQVRITKIQYDLGQKDQLLVELDKTIQLLKDSRCSDNAECTVAQQNLRKVLTDWGRAEERVPSSQLILSYQKFTNSFADEEMSSWAGHAALKRKMFPEAFALFKSAAVWISESSKKDEKSLRLFEGSLLGAIEASESSNQKNLKIEAYNLYLKLNPKGNKRFEVRYQIAQWHYTGNQYQPASEIFSELALDKEAPMSLRDKSADLTLDSMVLLKDEAQIEEMSLTLAKALSARKTEFMNIWRKSVLNQSAKIINDPAAHEGSLESLSKKLAQATNEGVWPFEQKRILLKNKLAIASRLKNPQMIAVAAEDISNDKRFSQSEINQALIQRAWVHEIKLDFNAALDLLKQVKPSKVEMAEHYFKLALLSELAHRNPTAQYQQYLSVSKNTSKRQFAIHQLILAAENPQKSFIKQASQLQANPALYVSAGIFAYEKSSDSRIAQKVLNFKSGRQSFEAQMLKRSLEMDSFLNEVRKIRKIQINTANDRTLQRNLVQKMRSLQALERKAQAFIQRKDSALQLMALSHVANENRQLAQDILSLPTPKKLTAAQKKMYQDQIQQQIRPFSAKAETIRNKALDLFEASIDQSIFKDVFDLAMQSNKPGSLIAQKEIEYLRQSAKLLGMSRDPFIIFTRERHKVASEAEKLSLRLAQNPFDYNDLESFAEAQKRLGSGPFVAYLEERLNGIKRGRN